MHSFPLSSYITMDHQMTRDEETGSSLHLAPSPQSEAVAHDFQELSLQSIQQLPPLKERKNGKCLGYHIVP